MQDALAPYRAKLVARVGCDRLTIDADDAYAKADVVMAEMVAMGVNADVADYAAQHFVWAPGCPDGGILDDDSLSIRALGALRRWRAAKAERAAA